MIDNLIGLMLTFKGSESAQTVNYKKCNAFILSEHLCHRTDAILKGCYSLLRNLCLILNRIINKPDFDHTYYNIEVTACYIT